MNRDAATAIARLFDAFPQSAANPDLTLDTFERILDGVPDQVIIDTVKRFLAGDVADQSIRFAPSIAEFNREARRIADLRSYAEKPRLPSPKNYRSTGLLPFEMRAEQHRQKFEGWDMVAENVSYDRFWSMHKAGELPEGSTWSAALNGKVFVPKKVA
jgi:hypothetical protein